MNVIYTTNKLVTPTAEKRIDRAVKAIDPRAWFQTHSAPGNPVKGWIATDNDNTVNHSDRQADFRRMKDVAAEMIEKAKAAR
jgi:hypothetical protein